MKKIRFAIIGCGRIGGRHAQHINRLGILKAVCDIRQDRAEEIGKACNANTYTDIGELLEKEELDVVSICTPNYLHAAHAIQALKAGFHVLCEKPMAISLHDCGEMIKIAEQTNRRLFIVKQNRFNPPVAAVKKAIDEGKLGKIFSIHLSCYWNRNMAYYNSSDWKGKKAKDGGTLYTQFSHFIDLLYWIFGDIKDVRAFTGNFNHEHVIEFEDTGVVIMKFYSGLLGSIHYTVNSYARNMEGSLTIFGEKGTVKIGGQYLNEIEYQNIAGFQIENLSAGNPANEYGDYQGSMSNHDKVYENLIDVLTINGAIATNGFEGLKTVEIIDKIYQSANQ